MNTARFAIPVVSILAACAGAPRPVSVHSLAPQVLVRWHGVVNFEARHPTPTGASRDLALRPARWVVVEALDAAGAVVGQSFSDALGHFELEAPHDARELVVLSHARWHGHDVSVSPDRTGRGLHSVRVPLGSPDVPITVTATDAAPGGPAGAFHIVDTLLQGVEAARVWTGQTLPPLWAWWGRGITNRWSYYLGERPAHSGRYALELLGGTAGHQDSTDTDEHDEAIILHEVGHFVFDLLSTSSSLGGMHPSGSLLDPGLAWEEGRATWFGAAVRASPLYQDTIGIEPYGRLRVDRHLEHPPDGPRGNASEASVSQVLWELSDGAGGLPDTDSDGVSLGPEILLRTMLAERDQPDAYPCLQSYVRDLVARGVLDPAALTHLLEVAGQPSSLLPTATVRAWPVDLPALPARVTGKVDGLTDPAPSGGAPRPENGYDAERVYGFHVTSRSLIVARLHIAGSGTPTDRTHLSLELRSHRADLLAATRGAGAQQAISRLVDPGYYLVYVRDAGAGNRAGFELDVQATPFP